MLLIASAVALLGQARPPSCVFAGDYNIAASASGGPPPAFVVFSSPAGFGEETPVRYDGGKNCCWSALLGTASAPMHRR